MTVEDKRPTYGPASRHGLSPFQSRIPHPSKRTVLEPLFPSLFVTNRVNRHFANGMRRNWTRCEKSMANKIVQHHSLANSGLDSISCWRLFVPTKPLDKHMQSLQTIFLVVHLAAMAKTCQKSPCTDQGLYHDTRLSISNKMSVSVMTPMARPASFTL